MHINLMAALALTFGFCFAAWTLRGQLSESQRQIFFYLTTRQTMLARIIDGPMLLVRRCLNSEQLLAEIVLSAALLVIGLTLPTIEVFLSLDVHLWRGVLAFAGSAHVLSMLWFGRRARLYSSILMAGVYAMWWYTLVVGKVQSPASILLFFVLGLCSVAVPRTLRNGQHHDKHP